MWAIFRYLRVISWSLDAIFKAHEKLLLELTMFSLSMVWQCKYPVARSKIPLVDMIGNSWRISAEWTRLSNITHNWPMLKMNYASRPKD